MSCADVMERPTKKRRFFVEEESVQDQSFSAEPSFPDELNAIPDTAADAPSRLDPDQAPSATDNQVHQDSSTANGFDPELFSSVVGEQLPATTISTLQSICGDDVQRGEIGPGQRRTPL